MASLQATGKMLTKLSDVYCDERDRLYREYSFNCGLLFRTYVSDRQRIFREYSESIDRIEWNHTQKIEPLDLGYQSSPDTLDKDISIDHAHSLEDFEQYRFSADAAWIRRLNEIYKAYKAERGALDVQYQSDRSTAYAKYRAGRDAIENEGRGEPS